jgi:hypothetical protein
LRITSLLQAVFSAAVQVFLSEIWGLAPEPGVTGDAVPALFTRQHVLTRLGHTDTAAFLELTSNAFLSGLARQTRVEA